MSKHFYALYIIQLKNIKKKEKYINNTKMNKYS